MFYFKFYVIYFLVSCCKGTKYLLICKHFSNYFCKMIAFFIFLCLFDVLLYTFYKYSSILMLNIVKNYAK